MAHPNNCGTCKHMQSNIPGNGWCYMFRDPPKGICAQHSGRKHWAIANKDWRK